MQLLRGLALLLLAQSAGELLARGLALPLPGPVIGMGLLAGVLMLPGVGTALAAPVGTAADALLAHLSLLFVPLGVGVIAHLPLLRQHGLALAGVLVASTAAGLAVTALVLQALWGGEHEPGDASADAGPEGLKDAA